MNTTGSIINFYFLNCGSSHNSRLFLFFYDFKSYFSERNFAAVPTFKELISSNFTQNSR
ncbi:hypothetical protein LEP1GSC170_6284 [Leptospira interrogans serovar Bataviae str. HAI135]|nr:hypothetical protein LEP1GSC170_6284 [Leptospira interrogans serovar Bataviae str. HAI135]